MPTVRMQYTGAIFRGDDRRALAAALPPASDDPAGSSRACFLRRATSATTALTRSARGCTSRSSGAGRSGFPGFAFSSKGRSTSTWYTSCSWSCWPWPGCPSAGGGGRHERIAGALGNRSSPRRAVCPAFLWADLDERTVGDHAAGRAGVRAWPGGRRLVLGDRRQSADRVAVVDSRCRVQRGHGRPVGLLPAAGLPDLAAGQRLRAGLLEADRASARTAGSCGSSTAR